MTVLPVKVDKMLSRQEQDVYLNDECDDDTPLSQRSRMLARRIAPKMRKPMNKLMCANRGEIAIRVFRAAHELGLSTLAIFSHEDSLSLHRFRADESYKVGANKSAVAAYLDIDDIIRIAKNNNVDCIHPGYGFLAESAEFARRCRANNIVFVGPSADVIDLLGTKTSARDIALCAGVAIIPGSPTVVDNVSEALLIAARIGLPLILKAAHGGGGRGIRVVYHLHDMASAFARSASEAMAAFGSKLLFIEKYVTRPRHIEVQIIADEYHHVSHIYERDCSVQRRFQKIVEFAPAQSISPATRDALHNDAIKIIRSVGYSNAGTVEFLVDEDEKHYFMEVNPRIQVEHTITEEVSGIDIVRCQIAIAGGATLAELNLRQEQIALRGCSIQLRVTTEDAADNFRPDFGHVEVYRSSGGIGVRQDSSCSAGSIITEHYDSLIVKLIVTATNFEQAVVRALRAITEFRICGVQTNIAFLQQLLSSEHFFSGRGTHTGFIDNTPQILQYQPATDRSSKLLRYLSDMYVNGCELPNKISCLPASPKVPALSRFNHDPEIALRGWRDVLQRNGAKSFANAVRQYSGALIMDTTWRDAHQSLLATRVRTRDIVRIAPATAIALHNAFSIEMWGGATFDVSLRFLHECPWDRLDILRKEVPNIPFQMLLRAANAVGYTTYPDNVVFEFVSKAKQHGIDIFRIFDSLNFIDNLRLGIDAVHAVDGVVEACLCYSGDVSDPTRTKYTLDYYLDLTQQLVDLDIHILAIKDMAGLLKPDAAHILVSAIRQRFPHLPIHVHTHDTAGTGVASMLACVQAGADIVDAATDCISGLTSQPSIGAIVRSLSGSKLDTGIQPDHLCILNDYWELTRELYAGFESNNLRSGNSDVYIHEMPGGQYTNLQFQAFKLGLGSQWSAIKQAYAHANTLLGDIIKVTPSSKVVGDLAQFLVQNSLNVESFRINAKSLSPPSSVVQFMQGMIGTPYGGFPEPLRSHIVRDLPIVTGRPGKNMSPIDLSCLRKTLEQKHGTCIRDVDVISAALYPQVFDEFCEFRSMFGDVSVLPTERFFQACQIAEEMIVHLERGKVLYIKLLAVGELQANGKRDVYWKLNGNARSIRIDDRNANVDSSLRRERATNETGSVGAPMSGVVIEIHIQNECEVKAGDPMAVLSAMKMETVIAAPVNGIVSRVSVKQGDTLVAGDLVAYITSKSSSS